MSNESSKDRPPIYQPVIYVSTGLDGLPQEDYACQNDHISYALSGIPFVELEDTDDTELPPGSRIGAFGKTVTQFDPIRPGVTRTLDALANIGGRDDVAARSLGAFDHMRSTIGTHMRRDMRALDNSALKTPILNPGSLPPRDQLHPHDIEAHNLYAITLKGLRAYLTDDPFHLPPAIDGVKLEHVELPRVYTSADGDPNAEYETLEFGYETVQITKADMLDLGMEVKFGPDEPDTALLNTGVTHVDLYSYDSEGQLDFDNSFSLVHDDNGFTTLTSSGSLYEAPIDTTKYAEALEAAEDRLVNYFDKITLFPGFWPDTTPRSLPDAAVGLQRKPNIVLRVLLRTGLASKADYTRVELQPGDQSKVQPDHRRSRVLPSSDRD